jgi:hypothetical protein
MPGHEPPTRPELVPEISTEEMLAARAETREKLVRKYHSHRMTANLYRKNNRPHLALIEEEDMKLTQAMLKDLEDEEEPGTTVRLIEGSTGV